MTEPADSTAPISTAQREREAEPDEHPLDHEPPERERVCGNVLAVQRDRSQADRDPDRDHPAHARRESRARRTAAR